VRHSSYPTECSELTDSRVWHSSGDLKDHAI